MSGWYFITQVRLFIRLTADDAIWRPDGITNPDIHLYQCTTILGVSAASTLIPERSCLSVAVY